MNETTLKKRIATALKARGIPNFAKGAGPYATTGMPDRLGTLPWSGRTLWLELKNPTKEAMRVRSQQVRRCDEFARAGALCIISNDYDYILQLIDKDLERCMRLLNMNAEQPQERRETLDA